MTIVFGSIACGNYFCGNCLGRWLWQLFVTIVWWQLFGAIVCGAGGSRGGRGGAGWGGLVSGTRDRSSRSAGWNDKNTCVLLSMTTSGAWTGWGSGAGGVRGRVVTLVYKHVCMHANNKHPRKRSSTWILRHPLARTGGGTGRRNSERVSTCLASLRPGVLHGALRFRRHFFVACHRVRIVYPTVG